MRNVVGFTRIVFSALCLLPLAAQSGPLFLEESAKLPFPDPRYHFRTAPAVDGDTAVLAGRYHDPSDFTVHDAAFVYERDAGGTWQFVTKLVETIQGDSWNTEMSVAIEGDTVFLSIGDDVAGHRQLVFQRGGAGWSQVAEIRTSEDDAGRQSELHAGTAVVGRSDQTWGASAFRRNASGIWEFIGQSGVTPSGGCIDSCGWDTDVDISGDTMVVAVPYAEGDESIGPGQVDVFELSAGAWPRTAVLKNPSAAVDLEAAVTLETDTVLASGYRGVGAQGHGMMSEFHRAAGVWAHADDVASADAFMLSAPSGIALDGGLLAALYPSDDQRGTNKGSVAVHRRDAAGRFEEVARLVASDSGADGGLDRGASSGGEVFGRIDFHERRIIAPGTGGAYVFDLPANLTQPANVQDDFEDGNSAGWTPLPGSMWSVVTSGNSKVFRQSNFGPVLDGAILGNTDWTNQAIEADVTPTAISGSDRWVGLAVRHTDANNYYYVTLRSSHTIQLRRMLNGSFVSLASASHAVALNHTYRLRLEAIGTWLRVYLDGKLVLQARDSTLSHGQAALLSFKAQADFDNVIVSPNPGLTLLADNFEEATLANAQRWSPGLTSDWAVTTDGSKVYSQRSTVGDARAVSGVSTGDQIIRTRARADAFNGADRWFGLMTRFVDDQNYYYVTIRNSNQIALRKLVNGAFTVLDTAPMTVSMGTWYNLRMESVGSKHRVYVNDFLVLEADDATHATGRYGFRTFKAAASYDDFTAMKP